MEGDPRNRPCPLGKQFGKSGDIDVRLGERIEQTLVRNVDLGNAQDVVDVAYDAYSGCGD